MIIITRLLSFIVGAILLISGIGIASAPSLTWLAIGAMLALMGIALAGLSLLSINRVMEEMD
tara:strand:+ start:2079 stop:2264 length:186 start_codon:yes stop_codon:yes gene_type:complete